MNNSVIEMKKILLTQLHNVLAYFGVLSVFDYLAKCSV